MSNLLWKSSTKKKERKNTPATQKIRQNGGFSKKKKKTFYQFLKMMKFTHVIGHLNKKIVFRDVFSVAFILYRFNGLNVGPRSQFDKIGRMVISLVCVIHSHPNPNPNKSMMRGSTYLKENNYISIYFMTVTTKTLIVNNSIGL